VIRNVEAVAGELVVSGRIADDGHRGHRTKHDLTAAPPPDVVRRPDSRRNLVTPADARRKRPAPAFEAAVVASLVAAVESVIAFLRDMPLLRDDEIRKTDEVCEHKRRRDDERSHHGQHPPRS